MSWVFFPDRAGGPVPEVRWPDALKAADFRKIDKKGAAEEIAGSLEAAEKTFRAMLGKLPGVPNRASREQANDFLKNAQSFLASGEVKKVAGSLQIVSKRAAKMISEAPKLKLDKKVVSALQTVRAAADDHVDALDRKKIIPKLGTLARDLEEADRQMVLSRIGPTMTAFKACAAKGHVEINSAARLLRNWRDEAEEGDKDEIRKGIYQLLRKACRDMSQNTGNLAKAVKAGGTIDGLEDRDVKTLPKLTTSLARVGNATSEDSVTGGLDRGGLAQLIRTVQTNAQLYDQIAGRLPG